MNERTTPELFDMSDHVAVITGAGRGIGEGIAKSFSEAGASVVVAARRTEEIDRVVQKKLMPLVVLPLLSLQTSLMMKLWRI